MPVYSEPISDEILLKSLTDSKNVVIIGCKKCANVSCNLYYSNNEPAYNLLFKPLSLDKEIKRLKKLLKKYNYKVDSFNILSLCQYSEGLRKNVVKNSKGKDTVIIMACPGGAATVSKIIDDKKIVSGMKLKGIKSIEKNFKGGKIYIRET